MSAQAPNFITVEPLKNDFRKLPDLKDYGLTALRKHSDETKPQPKPQPKPEPEHEHEHEHDFKSWPELPFAR